MIKIKDYKYSVFNPFIITNRITKLKKKIIRKLNHFCMKDYKEKVCLHSLKIKLLRIIQIVYIHNQIINSLKVILFNGYKHIMINNNIDH